MRSWVIVAFVFNVVCMVNVHAMQRNHASGECITPEIETLLDDAERGMADGYEDYPENSSLSASVSPEGSCWGAKSQVACFTAAMGGLVVLMVYAGNKAFLFDSR